RASRRLTLSFECSRPRRDLPSFPTRRSSDLDLVHHEGVGRVQHVAVVAQAGLQRFEPGMHLFGRKFGFEALETAGPGIHVDKYSRAVDPSGGDRYHFQFFPPLLDRTSPSWPPSAPTSPATSSASATTASVP